MTHSHAPHFLQVGMSAVTLEQAPICFNWGETMISLAVVVILMIAVIKVASMDIFATSKRAKILNDIHFRSTYTICMRIVSFDA